MNLPHTGAPTRLDNRRVVQIRKPGWTSTAIVFTGTRSCGCDIPKWPKTLSRRRCLRRSERRRAFGEPHLSEVGFMVF